MGVPVFAHEILGELVTTTPRQCPQHGGQLMDVIAGAPEQRIPQDPAMLFRSRAPMSPGALVQLAHQRFVDISQVQVGHRQFLKGVR
jgi:hypothetical protein